MARRSGQAGFTLIEMMVVLVVLGLAAGIVLARGPLRSPATDLRATGRVMAQAMRSARDRAITEDHDIVFTVDPARRDFGVLNAAKRTALPAAISPQERPPAVIFHPDGSASGGELQLAEAGRQIAIRVDWLTGSVSLR